MGILRAVVFALFEYLGLEILGNRFFFRRVFTRSGETLDLHHAMADSNFFTVCRFPKLVFIIKQCKLISTCRFVKSKLLSLSQQILTFLLANFYATPQKM